MTNCKICGTETEHCFDGLILRKYSLAYYKCTHCGFIQTDSPFWLEEAYSSAITKQDIGLIARNLYIAPILSSLIKKYYRKNGKFIDFGGGYGILTRIMRDKGFDFKQYDTYCDNIFADGFNVAAPRQIPDYELLTAFEVFEHLVDPLRELEGMLKWSSSIFFSTELQPPNINSLGDWWYIMPETGQHIAFYTIKSLQIMAEKNGLNFYTNGFNLHLFTKIKINSSVFKIITKYRVARLLDFLYGNNKSLTMDDYYLSKQ